MKTSQELIEERTKLYRKLSNTKKDVDRIVILNRIKEIEKLLKNG